MDNRMTSKDEFLDRVDVLFRAGVGVVCVRTRETYRAIEALQMRAAAVNVPAMTWNIVDGWGRVNANGVVADHDNATREILAALRRIKETVQRPDDATTAELASAMWIMQWPHVAMKPDRALPPVVQVLADLAAAVLPPSTARMALVCPQEFSLPTELEDLVPVLDYDVPTQDELTDIVADVLDTLPDDARPQYTGEEIREMVVAGAGMSWTEFETALSKALMTYRKDLPDVPADKIIASVQKSKVEVIKRSEVLEIMPPATLSDVGGMHALKDWVAVRKHAFDAEAREHGVDAPKGVAMVGAPGTGKSLAAKAIASELGVPLIRFDVSRVFGSLVGQSEGRVRAALKTIDAIAPCVVLLDEVDKAFDIRSGSGDSGVGQRVLGAILTHMQESDKEVFWVLTANRTEGLPPELLRKGRLDEVWAVTMPTPADREEIFRIHLRKRNKDVDAIADMDVAVSAAEGYVPAEMEAAVKEACIRVYDQWIRDGRIGDIPQVTGQMLAEELANIKPLSHAFAEQFAAMETWARNHARMASGETHAETVTAGRKRRRRIELEG